MNFIAIGSILGALVVILGAFGAHGLKDILDDVFLYSKNHDINVEAFQSNHEGEIVDFIQKLNKDKILFISFVS